MTKGAEANSRATAAMPAQHHFNYKATTAWQLF